MGQNGGVKMKKRAAALLLALLMPLCWKGFPAAALEGSGSEPPGPESSLVLPSEQPAETLEPTKTPQTEPTLQPSPEKTPSPEPTESPEPICTETPVPKPSQTPLPSGEPKPDGTSEPTEIPTPSESPEPESTAGPTASPHPSGTPMPTALPSAAPTETPVPSLTPAPTEEPEECSAKGQPFFEPDPEYTVQYYGMLSQYEPPAWWQPNELEFIDTTAAANGGVPRLPQNGVPLVFQKVYLQQTADGFEIPLTPVLTEIYASRTFRLSLAGGPDAANILTGNSHYALREIWKLKEGAPADSKDPLDWEIFPPDTSFTADPAVEGSICIDPDTVLRFVYDPTKTPDGAEVPAAFYDYDVTDGNPIQQGDLWMLNTQHFGIHSPGNYPAGGGTRLAFGSGNIGTDYEKESWNGNLINQFNPANAGNGGKGNQADAACYGMVTGLNEKNELIYAPGLCVPNLFGEGPELGKTPILGKSLLFDRDGDTYVLSAVSGTGIDHLSVLQQYEQGKPAWTNEFWPMDVVNTGDDPHLGGPNNEIYRVPAFGGSKPPVSDSASGQAAEDHNNYFGMSCALDFEIPEGYKGPLNLMFFGDDDMWAFVDGRLVLDIGGVHVGTGIYTDLWDYLPKGTAGKHQLRIFYTERGASGSACYLRFTLPGVNGYELPPVQQSLLHVQKELRGPAMDPDIPFPFRLELWDEAGVPLEGKLPYRIFDESGMVISEGSFSPGSQTFSLSDGEYMEAVLPVGTQYCVEELINETAPPCRTSIRVNDGAVQDGSSCCGTISPEPEKVLFINEQAREMPATGGKGTEKIYLAGLILLFLAAAIRKNTHRKEF